jgi:thiamine pyrophosphate-dependent acetolactate synthase large subunit-like protein
MMSLPVNTVRKKDGKKWHKIADVCKLVCRLGIQVTSPDVVADAIKAGLQAKKPVIVEILTEPLQIYL